MRLFIRLRFAVGLVFALLGGVSLCSAADDVSAFTGLTRRLLAGQAVQVKGELIPGAGGKDRFELETVGNNLIVRGNNANSMAVGLNHYLRYYCKTNISWYANNPVQVPKVLPAVPEKVSRDARCENRFFLNYCTFGYTMPWWQWRDWERLIDWMALNGVTMPLAITGQEAVWYRVWQKFGLSDEQIRGYFTGPAHLPWHRMANFDYWGGPLPMGWLDHQVALQQKIVARERELNMTPVLPAFAGHVPAAIKTKFPDAKISRLGFWGGFADKYRCNFLDPLDPLFPKIQKAFMEEQTRLFGTDHIYGTDPFNEVTPPSWEPDYLAKVGKTIYDSMAAVDPDAKWLQMTWVFYFDRKNWTNERIQAMLRAVPQDHMILLDYYCENQEVWKMTEKFFGQPYLWCYLGNFGGNTMLVGNLAEVEKRIENTFANGGDRMWGLGSTLEAFDTNPVMYDYLFEKAWSTGPTDVSKWIADYGASRDGDTPAVRDAWKALLEKVYVAPAMLGQGPLTNARPWYKGQGQWTTNPSTKYENKDLLAILDRLLSSPLPGRDSYRYDAVNLCRQVLGNHFLKLRAQFTAACDSKDAAAAAKCADSMRELLRDLEGLLATRDDFMLGKWLADARAFGKDDAEKRYYEQNARNLLSTWGEDGQSLNDYANRTWSGLVGTHYLPRWDHFLTEAVKALKENRTLDQKEFEKTLTEMEGRWVRTSNPLPAAPKGDSLEAVKRLTAKYHKEIGEAPALAPTAGSNSKRHEEVVAAVKKEKFDLVMIGDSITHTLHGFGGKYVPLEEVWAKHFAPRRALNLGFSGYRVENILWNLQNGELEGQTPKVAVLLIGTNNADGQNFPAGMSTPEQIYAGTQAIVETIQKKSPATKILILRIFPKGGKDETGTSEPIFHATPQEIETARRAGALTEKLADNKRVFWLDVGNIFLLPNGKVNTELMPDLLHPNAAGAEAWANAIEPTLSRLMGDKPVK